MKKENETIVSFSYLCVKFGAGVWKVHGRIWEKVKKLINKHAVSFSVNKHKCKNSLEVVHVQALLHLTG